MGRFRARRAATLIVTLVTVATTAGADADLRLVEAARNRDAQQVRVLLNQKVDVNVRAHDGATALLWAAHWNDLATGGLLIRDKEGSKREHANTLGMSLSGRIHLRTRR